MTTRVSRTTERVLFRLIITECCRTMLCWVNPRLPNYCPECGSSIYPRVRSWIIHTDDGATLKVIRKE